MTSAEKLGNMIGNMINEQQTTNYNIQGQSISTTKTRRILEDFKLVGQVTLTKKVPLSDSFILDHPVQGELDSAVYKLDGGYDSGQEQVLDILNF